MHMCTVRSNQEWATPSGANSDIAVEQDLSDPEPRRKPDI